MEAAELGYAPALRIAVPFAWRPSGLMKRLKRFHETHFSGPDTLHLLALCEDEMRSELLRDIFIGDGAPDAPPRFWNAKMDAWLMGAGVSQRMCPEARQEMLQLLLVDRRNRGEPCPLPLDVLFTIMWCLCRDLQGPCWMRSTRNEEIDV